MPELVEFDLNPDSLYFNDGQRKVDYVLVYEDESKRESQNTFHKKQKRKRQVYESNLISRGLQLEATKSVMDEKLIFVKVHAPWEVLCSYAEIMHIKLPLQPDDTKTHDSALTWISRFFNVDENVINPEQDFFTAAFENERISHFYIQDKDSFFNSATRSRIVYFILCRGEYAIKDNVKKFGINRLLDSGIYKAAFPLHDPPSLQSYPNDRIDLHQFSGSIHWRFALPPQCLQSFPMNLPIPSGSAELKSEPKQRNLGFRLRELPFLNPNMMTSPQEALFVFYLLT
ncbi:PREDICTED: anoctamin-6-like [Thamnophis sirtalis]|uniref:Anoctamin-6-like n=1 Tax=Thamnophis sirtalis TaxID=35019 RepID=A0A6I9X4Z4_9SAUR|nr:PREDICTED: anoctamin-6-like [Thamnophis sirtalis]